MVDVCGGGGGGGGDDDGGACMRACRGRACTRARVGVRRRKATKGREILSALFCFSPSPSPRFFLLLSLSLSFSFPFPLSACLSFYLSLFLSFSPSPSFPLSLSSVRAFVSRCPRAAWGVWCNELENHQYPSTDKYRPRLATARAPPQKISLQRENGTFSPPPCRGGDQWTPPRPIKSCPASHGLAPASLPLLFLHQRAVPSLRLASLPVFSQHPLLSPPRHRYSPYSSFVRRQRSLMILSRFDSLSFFFFFIFVSFFFFFLFYFLFYLFFMIFVEKVSQS